MFVHILPSWEERRELSEEQNQVLSAAVSIPCRYIGTYVIVGIRFSVLGISSPYINSDPAKDPWKSKLFLMEIHTYMF